MKKDIAVLEHFVDKKTVANIRQFTNYLACLSNAQCGFLGNNEPSNVRLVDHHPLSIQFFLFNENLISAEGNGDSEKWPTQTFMTSTIHVD